MKIKNILLAVILTITVTACALTKSNPASPINGGHDTNAPAIIVNPVLQSDIDKVNATIAQIAPFASAAYPPSAPFIAAGSTAFNSIATLLVAGAGILAGFQSKKATKAQADADKHKAAAATLAAAVVANPPALAAATTIAANNGTAGTVAEHIASAASPT